MVQALGAPIRRIRIMVREAGTAQPRLLVTAAGVGLVTGLGVAALEQFVADGLLDLVLDRPIALAAIVPLLGLVVCRLCLSWFVPGADGATTDAYVRAYHAPERGRVRGTSGRSPCIEWSATASATSLLADLRRHLTEGTST